MKKNLSGRKTIAKIKTVKLSKTSYAYDGKTKTPSVVVKDSNGKTLKKGTDYTVSYIGGRKNIGKYTVKVTFIGKYSGSKALTFSITPVKTSISSLTAGTKRFTVKWSKKTSQVSGYQVQYCTSYKFDSSVKTVTFSKNRASSTIKGLKANKNYYVRIRTYKTINGNEYYSGWSSVKRIKTK